MSYWHTCPGCAAQAGRRRYEDADNLRLCTKCKESRVYAIAYQEGAERVLLVRDVADVAYHAERCDDALREVNEVVAEGYDLSADDAESERWLRRQLDTMLPWLARAKAVLG